MKNNIEFKNEIKQLSADELRQRIDDLRRELFGIRLNSVTSHIKDYSQVGKLRKNVARAMTELRARAVQSVSGN